MLLVSRSRYIVLGAPRAVAALAVAEMTAWGILYYAYAVLLGPLANALQTTEPIVAGAFSVATLTSGLASPRIGAAVDRWGARSVMTLAACLAAVAFGLLAVVESLAELYVLWAVLGVAQAGVFYEPAFAALTRWFPVERERLRALLVVTVVGGLASTVFLPLTAWLIGWAGLRGCVLALAGLLAIVVVPLFALLPSTTKEHETLTVNPEPGEQRSPRARQRNGEAGHGLRILTATFAAQAFASSAVALYLVSHLQNAGVTADAAAGIAGAIGVAQVLGRLAISPLRARVSSQRRLPLLLGMQAVALVLFAAGAAPQTHVAVILFGLANGLVTLERATLVVERFGTRAYGETIGRIARASLVARAGAPLAVGAVGSYIGFDGAFLGLAALLAVGAVAAVLATSAPRGAVARRGVPERRSCTTGGAGPLRPRQPLRGAISLTKTEGSARSVHKLVGGPLDHAASAATWGRRFGAPTCRRVRIPLVLTNR